MICAKTPTRYKKAVGAAIYLLVLNLAYASNSSENTHRPLKIIMTSCAVHCGNTGAIG